MTSMITTNVVSDFVDFQDLPRDLWRHECDDEEKQNESRQWGPTSFCHLPPPQKHHGRHFETNSALRWQRCLRWTVGDEHSQPSTSLLCRWYSWCTVAYWSKHTHAWITLTNAYDPVFWSLYLMWTYKDEHESRLTLFSTWRSGTRTVVWWRWSCPSCSVRSSCGTWNRSLWYMLVVLVV